MTNTLKEFKNAVGLQISNYLQEHHPVNYRNTSSRHLIVIKLHGDSFAYLLDFEEKTCQFITDTKIIDDLTETENVSKLYDTDEKEKRSIHQLLSQLVQPIEEMVGFELWKSIREELKAMPGFWSFLTPLRALTLSLQDILKEFSPKALHQEDNALFRTLINKLKAEIEYLLQLITELTQQSRELTLENEKLRIQADAGEMSAEEAERTIKKKYDHILSQNAGLVEQLNQAKTNYETLAKKYKQAKTDTTEANNEIRALNIENEQLAEKLEQTIASVEESSQEIETIIDSFIKVHGPHSNEPKTTATIHNMLSIRAINERHKQYRLASGGGNYSQFFKRTMATGQTTSVPGHHHNNGFAM
ncbi:hypothetical protein [Legionella fairfieldensis]|uniref:hypothetical protein n=1 Tax=Legionella fairfieldensis TaxID=45064 RepID=UPI00055A1BF1|nr:hypothetical protein [Legionella fairfieldensis]